MPHDLKALGTHHPDPALRLRYAVVEATESGWHTRILGGPKTQCARPNRWAVAMAVEPSDCL